MTGSPSSTAASPPSPRIFDTPPTTPPREAASPTCPPAPRPQLTTRNSARYFIVADAGEMNSLRCTEGDFATIRGGAENFVRQQGEWHACRPQDVYEQARSRGLLLSPSSCWTQGPMRLSAAFWNRQPTANGNTHGEVVMRRPVQMARATLAPLSSLQRSPSQVGTALQSPIQIRTPAPAEPADKANTQQGNT